ncbi:MAG: methyltransferase [Bacteroidetes bacterium]|nr:methyltransferase [Bacteroidota bacterium]
MLKSIVQGIVFLFGGWLKKRNFYLTSSLEYLERKRTIDKNYLDYIRLSSLELISHEINFKKVKGNVAELGVYKGKFARYINQYFPDRTLYLFDTFLGFDERDKISDVNHGFSEVGQDFSNTSVKKVLSLMPYPEKCKVVQGFFPDSAGAIDDIFAFVSIDTDLYEPVLKGLQFFFPKMVKGGYIFVHDFNNDGYKGARKGVEDFCSENNVGYVPIPDLGGSVVIVK